MFLIILFELLFLTEGNIQSNILYLVAFKDAPQVESGQAAPRSEKMASAASNKGKEKDKGGKGKDKAAKEKDKSSRPPSQQFDHSKPNWTLRVVSDATAAVSQICSLHLYKLTSLVKKKCMVNFCASNLPTSFCTKIKHTYKINSEN